MITRISIENFLGISAKEYRFDKAGAVIEGKNGSGKTSVLEAIRTALTGRGANESAIRKGADQAEILLDLDDITVRRLITQTSSTLTVTREDGQRQRSPQTFLSELLGVAPLDPIDLVFENDPKKRRATILSAIPCKLTSELVSQWMPGIPGGTYELDTSGHGLEALERLRSAFYDRRALANKEAKMAGETHAHARQKQAQLSVEPADRTSIEEAERARELARQNIANTTARMEAANAARDRAKSTDERVRALREESKAAFHRAQETAVNRRDIDADLELRAQERELVGAGAHRVTNAERELELARRSLATRLSALKEIESRLADRETKQAESQRHYDRAEELESRAAEMASVGSLFESPEVLQAATDEALAEAQAAAELVVRAKTWAEYEAVCAQTTTASINAKAAKDKADALDKIVRTLTDDAPAELLKAAGGVPGLTVDGDSIMLDGVSLDRLSGAEKIRFAVQIAKRLNAKSRLIIVDGLERLDVEQLPVFLAEATSDGFQVIGTRVGIGPAHAVKIGGAT